MPRNQLITSEHLGISRQCKNNMLAADVSSSLSLSTWEGNVKPYSPWSLFTSKMLKKPQQLRSRKIQEDYIHDS